jgi:hypothetical protein
VVREPAPPPPLPAPPDPREVAGSWSWSHVSDADGVRRVEHELWVLERHAEGVRGRYHRTITFLSVDGRPFECTQTASYHLRAVYQLDGRLAGDHVELRETDYQVAESPCERGFRRLASYRARVDGGRLELESEHGTQVLGPAPGDSPAPAPRSANAAGAWTWSTRSIEPTGEAAGATRIEQEDWQLEVAADGVIGGWYVRTVTVFDEDGRPFACSGEPRFQYRDRYRLRGAGSGRRLTVTEIEVETVPNRCVRAAERHLDAAVGHLDGDYLVLEWRGGRRQVLHRLPDDQR